MTNKDIKLKTFQKFLNKFQGEWSDTYGKFANFTEIPLYDLFTLIWEASKKEKKVK